MTNDEILLLRKCKWTIECLLEELDEYDHVEDDDNRESMCSLLKQISKKIGDNEQ